MFERARLPGGNRRGAEPVPAASLRSHQHHGGLNLRAAIHEDDRLPCKSGERAFVQGPLQQQDVALLVGQRHVEPMIDLSGEPFGPIRQRFVASGGRRVGCDAAAHRHAASHQAERPSAPGGQPAQAAWAGLIAPTVCDSSN